jgi:elongator complex protein 3
VTRVEIGYQTTDDAINSLNKRGHGNAESIRATRLLKDAGFKVVAHMMPNLLGATPEGDIESLDRVFSDASFRPDELKIYPMVVTDHAELTEIWKNGGFEPYSDEVLIELMSELEGLLPEYVRLNRSYRDIPANQILAGCKSSNLRELTATRMKQKGIVRKDISAREIRAKVNKPENAVLEMISYEASGGKEYFLQYIDPVDRTLFGILRLRIPSSYFHQNAEVIFESLRNAAIIREIHVYGDQLPIGAPPDGSGQHMGFGRKLLEKAEEIVRSEFASIEKIAVISGVGVRGYYRKFGYELSSVDDGGYMVKKV